jgi:two-component system nitrate/nitrite response regulator NarL
MEKKRILLVDDHQLVLEGFKMIISKEENFEVVGEAKDGLEAVDLTGELDANLVMMDINLPSITGIEATRKIKAKYPKVKVIMLSMNESQEYIVKADQAGADGYLLKSLEKDELVEAINAVLGGGKYYCKALSPELVNLIANKKYKTELNDSLLTNREIDIIKELALGSSSKEIAKKLFISDRTVNTHKTNIYKKMDVKNSVELLVKAKERMII